MPQNEDFNYKDIDMRGHDEELGITAARENLSLSSEELKARFMQGPVGFMTSAGINPEEELSPNVQDAVAGLNAEVRPIVMGDAISRLDSINSPKAKELFKNLAASQFGADNIENLTMDQVNQLMQNDELKAMNEEKMGSDATYLHEMTKAFGERDKLQQYDAKREGYLNRMWQEVEPLTIAKAQALVQKDATQRGAAVNTAAPQYTAPTVMAATGPNISVAGTNESDLTFNENAPAANSTFGVNAPAPEAGLTMNVQGETDTTPAMTIQGASENPNFIYDDIKGAEAAPITVDGNIPNDTSVTVDGNVPTTPEDIAQTQNAAVNTAQNPTGVKPFDSGFKMKDETKKGVAAKNKSASFWGEGGILEQFVSAKSPEDAFQGLFINMLLYLPAIGVKQMEMQQAKMKERNDYMKEKRNAFEDQVAQMKGLGATDRMQSIHQDFIKTGGDMAALAGQIREQNPELMKNLGIQFDENGMAKEVSPKQEEALAKAMMSQRYAELYNGVLPSQNKMKEMWETHKWMKDSGQYKQMQPQTETAQPQTPAEENTQAPDAPTNAPETPAPEAEEKPAETPAPEQTQGETATASDSTGVHESVEKPKEQTPIDVNELSVNPQILGVNSLEAAKEKMMTVDNKPVAARTPMDIKKAHEMSVSVANPSSLKADLGAFSVSVNGLMQQQKTVENNRAALTLARTPRTVDTQNIGNIRVGAERA